MKRPVPAPNVLVAVDDAVLRRVRHILSSCRVTFVRNRQRLEEALGERFDLVLIGSEFDAGRPLPAIDRAVRGASDTPVVCVITRHDNEGCVGGWRYTAFRSACLELGACDTLDFTRWRDDLEGNAQLRTLISSVLPS